MAASLRFEQTTESTKYHWNEIARWQKACTIAYHVCKRLNQKIAKRKMKIVRANIMRIATHDFRRTLRNTLNYVEKEQIYKIITESKRTKLVNFIKLLAYSMVIFLFVNYAESKNYITVNTQYFSFSIPSLYLIFASAFLLSVSVNELINYFIINELQRVACNHLFKFDNSTFRGLIYNIDDLVGAVTSIQFRYFNGPRYTIPFILAISIASMMPLVIVISLLLINIIKYFINYLLGYSFIYFGIPISIVGILIFFPPLIFVVYLFKKPDYSKNVMYIRWNFLYPLYKKNGDSPPHLSKWLK